MNDESCTRIHNGWGCWSGSLVISSRGWYFAFFAINMLSHSFRNNISLEFRLAPSLVCEIEVRWISLFFIFFSGNNSYFRGIEFDAELPDDDLLCNGVHANAIYFSSSQKVTCYQTLYQHNNIKLGELAIHRLFADLQSRVHFEQRHRIWFYASKTRGEHLSEFFLYPLFFISGYFLRTRVGTRAPYTPPSERVALT